MTREEKLFSMTMVSLVEVANKLGVKIDKKGAKAKAVAKILAAENAQNEVKNPDEIPDDEYVAEVMEQKKELGIECPPIENVEIVSNECAGDGTPLAEVGKEIVEQAKEKAKNALRGSVLRGTEAEEIINRAEAKIEAEKKAKSKKKRADRLPVKETVDAVLSKYKAIYKVIGKRIRLFDKAGTCYAYICFYLDNAKVFIREDFTEQYSVVADRAVDSKYKEKYNKIVEVKFNEIGKIIPKIAVKA